MFKQNINDLEKESRVLLEHIDITEYYWKDSVKNHYYNYFIPDYKIVIPEFIKSLTELDEVLEKIKRELGEI